jgi:glycosyltransferase involved in cell wall biosynthesis
MDSPLVTVIVTTFNYAHTVGTAIESALAQDYPNLEVVVVDNASTDTTSQLVRRYMDDSRFRYVRNPTNIGMVPNHNKGLREAHGSYVLFLSADDLLMPHHISRSFAYLREHPDIDVLYTSSYFIDEAGTFIGVRAMTGQPLGPYRGGRNEFAHLFTEGCYMCFPTMLMRRDLFERYGELDEQIKAADYEIVIRWAANGVRFGYLPEQLCAVRLHTAQQSSHQNYVVGGGDVREFAYMVRKFCEPYGHLLDGYEQSVSRSLWARYTAAVAAGVDDSDNAIRNDLLEVDGLLARAKARTAEKPRRLRPTVVVLPGARIEDTVATLRSLVAQTLTEWEAIVLDYGSVPFAGTAKYIDPAGRIRPLRLSAPVSEVVAINTALRVSSGDWYLAVHPGTLLPPTHLEHLAAALRSSGAQLVRTTASYGPRIDIFPPPNESQLPFVAPFGPLESIAFTRILIDGCGTIDERLGVFAEWEFFVRAALSSPVIAVDSRIALGAPSIPLERFADLPAFARSLHAMFRTNDEAMVAKRDAYLRLLERELAGGLPATSDAVERLLQTAYGTELLAGVS